MLQTEPPSYARPTIASRLRQSTSATSDPKSTRPKTTDPSSLSYRNTGNGLNLVVVNGKSWLYHDGSLVARKCGFLVSTISTINKFGFNECRREKNCGVCHPSLAEPKPSNLTDHYVMPTAASDECSEPAGPTPANPTPIMPQAEFDDMVERMGISIRTRLNRNAWAGEPANNVHLDHDELFDLLSRAERLAKRCLWRWLRINHPEKCEFRNLRYASDMDFGRSRLENLTFGETRFYDFRWTESAWVERVLDDLITLRNKVHHFNGFAFNMIDVDCYLHSAQWLAVLLYDEESATIARGLRDRLRRTAEGVAREIETIGLLTALPFAGDYPWQPHHLELFETVWWRRYNNNGDEDGRVSRQYSPAVIAAVLGYQGRGPYISCDRQPEAEESLSNVKRLEDGGYRGVDSPGSPGSESDRGRTTRQSLPSRWRSASANGPRGLPSHGEQARTRDRTRRGSICLGGSAEERSLL